MPFGFFELTWPSGPSSGLLPFSSCLVLRLYLLLFLRKLLPISRFTGLGRNPFFPHDYKVPPRGWPTSLNIPDTQRKIILPLFPHLSYFIPPPYPHRSAGKSLNFPLLSSIILNDMLDLAFPLDSKAQLIPHPNIVAQLCRPVFPLEMHIQGR